MLIPYHIYHFSLMKKIQSAPFGSIFFLLLHNTKFTYIKKEGDAHEYS